MVKIKFDEKGNPTPYNFITLSFEEIQNNYVDNFTNSITRKAIIAGYTNYCNDLKPLVSSLIQWIDGSFSTNKLKLAFSTTYAASFGVLLEIKKTDLELISKTYETVDCVFNLFNNLNNDSLTYSVINELKAYKMLDSIKNFYDIQNKYNNDIIIKWGDTFSNSKQVHIGKDRVSYISKILGDFKSKEKEKYTVSGIIKGVSLLNHRIEYLDNYVKESATAEEYNIFKASQLLDKNVLLEIEVSISENETTGQEEKSIQIISVN